MTHVGGRDWAELPLDMLRSIAELLGAADFIRFGAVCSSWAPVADDGISLPQGPQMPYLLHLTDDDDEGDAVLVSFPDKRCHRISGVPELRGKWLVGSQDGWLALRNERSEVSLLNPLTRAQIHHLPSITTLPQFKPVYSRDAPGEISSYLGRNIYPITFEQMQVLSFKKVVFSSKPVAGGTTPTAMAIFNTIPLPAIAIAGEGKWTCLTGFPIIVDIIYHDGKFLAVANNGELWSIEAIGSSLKVAKIAEGFGRCEYRPDNYFLVIDSSDGLLLAWRIGDGNGGTKRFKVSKFNAEQGSWLTLKSLGDNSLFLGVCYSISLSALEIPGLRPNCIYYTHILWKFAYEKDVARRVFVFNLEDESFDYYIPSDPRFNWPPPLWVAPSLL